MPSTPIRTSGSPAARFTVRHLRWYICTLLLLASSINYVDRQTLSVLKPHLQLLLKWSESDYGWIVFGFTLAYAIMMTISGPLIDGLGTRLGFALSVAWWSLAAMAHALARGAFSFGAARFLLGAGEAGNFPASIKAVAEWFPPKERALATGIFNAGTNIGTVVAPPVVVALTLKWGWQSAFIFTGAVGFLWLILWLLSYRSPRQHGWLSGDELEIIERDESLPPGASAAKIPWRTILRYRQAWGFVAAKFLTDPIWWFYIYWLPSYLKQARGFTLQEIGYFAWIPFWTAGFGSVAGGWFSGFLMKRGWTANGARKAAMAACAFSMPAGIAAVFASNTALALAFISLSTSAHQGWSANVFTLPSDMFPKQDVGTVVGLGGTGGAVGGMVLALTAGYILQWFHSYVALFVIAGVMHPLAMAVVHLLIPRIERVETGTAQLT
jgi:MFS transporter, ACS family, aldohexuronate transporter